MRCNTLMFQAVIEEIQDSVIETLRDFEYDCVANCYAAYRSEQSRYREKKNKIDKLK